MAEVDNPSRQQTPLTRRRRVAALVAAVAVLSSAAGVGASTFIRSPQQQAAEANGPGPTVLTAKVERRILRDTVVVRGTAVGGRTIDFQPVVADGKKPIITAVRTKPGASIGPGKVIMEISGRPVFALAGEKPAYRDLLPGSQGDDVAQLQDALKDLGYSPGDSNGVFGAGTKHAVTTLYQHLGYEVPVAAGTDETALNNAEDQVVQANRAVEDAAARLKATTDIAAARKAFARAREDAARANRQKRELEEHSGPMLPLAEAVFLPEFPARIEKINTSVGATVEKPPLTLSSGELVSQAFVNSVQRRLLKVGMTVEIHAESLVKPVRGRISAIGEFVSDPSNGSTGNPITVTPTDRLPARLSGQDVRLTVVRAATPTPVLAVPQSAVFTSIEGVSTLLVKGPDGSVDKVEVETAATGDGYVAITAANGSRLEAGADVVIGDEAAGVSK